jgi:hypothetical protein
MRHIAMIAIIVANGLAVLTLAPVPAMAVSPPSTGTATASVTVEAPSTGTGTITLAITSPASFSLGTTYAGQPAIDTNAIDYTVTTDDASGFTVYETATDFVSGSNTIPATALHGALNSGTTINAICGFTSCGYNEVESPGSVETFANHTAATSGDAFTEDLDLTPPASTAPGTYTSCITETASAN